MSEDVLERVRVFVMSQEPWRAIEALRLIDALAAEVRKQRARAERAERVAVWAVVNGVAYRESGAIQYESWENGTVSLPLRDDTDTDLFRALVEACEGGRDHG